jgi:hypothetical protein
MRRFALGALLIACTWPTVSAWSGGEIYGTITTHRNEEFRGPIRWDLNENFWDDILDAEKRDKVFVDAERSRVRIFGLSFGDDDGYWLTHPFKIQFGHMEAIEPRGGHRVRIELKGGTHIDVNSESTDLGDGMRGLVIFEDGHDVELEWDEVDRIEFSAGPGIGRDEMRLYGTVETTAGDFTGYVVWDRDEALTTDVLDGREDGRKHKIEFGDIREIERRGSGSSRVTLKDGKRLRLSDSNDVDDDNRGIDITVPQVGLIKVEWEDFDRVVFSDPPRSRTYDDFDGGRRLYGTVRDDQDRIYTGFVTWDLDEKFTWEYLDGQVGDVEFEILFENIASIERYSRRSAEVKLLNGMVFTLSDSNDVDRDNKGIVVEMDEGDEMEFDWYDFGSVEFSEP